MIAHFTSPHILPTVYVASLKSYLPPKTLLKNHNASSEYLLYINLSLIIFFGGQVVNYWRKWVASEYFSFTLQSCVLSNDFQLELGITPTLQQTILNTMQLVPSVILMLSRVDHLVSP